MRVRVRLRVGARLLELRRELLAQLRDELRLLLHRLHARARS